MRVISTQNKIQKLQKLILQKYFEIQMKAKFGDNWIDKVVDFCKNIDATHKKDNVKQPYHEFVKKCNTKGRLMVLDFCDVTMLASFLQYDFVTECIADTAELTNVGHELIPDLFKPQKGENQTHKGDHLATPYQHYINDIKEDRNAFSHNPNPDDTIQLESKAIRNLSDFIVYLERLGWGTGTEEKEAFIKTFKKAIRDLSNEINGQAAQTFSTVPEDLIVQLFEKLVKKSNANLKINESNINDSRSAKTAEETTITTYLTATTNTDKLVKKNEALSVKNEEKESINKKIVAEKNDSSDVHDPNEETAVIKKGSTTKKSIITISVQNQKGIPVSGYKLRMLNSSNETVAMWTSSSDSFTFLLDTGEYRIVEDRFPQGYKSGQDYLFSVTTESTNHSYVKTVEQDVNTKQNVKPEPTVEQNSEPVKQHKFASKENESIEKFKQLLLASNKGDVKAYLGLGICYYEGKGVEKNPTEAVNWFRKAAIKGNAEARYRLAKCFLNGEGVEKKDYLAYKWFDDAARQGHPKAQYEVGNCYINGIGIKPDEASATYWYKKAAEKGIVEAKNALYEINTKQPIQSNNICQNVTTKTNTNVSTQSNEVRNKQSKEVLVGEYNNFNQENVTKVNISAEVRRYLELAVQGNANAQYNLACLYSFGRGVEKNIEKAVHWYLKSAEQGYVRAQYIIGSCYFNGIVFKKDMVKAFEWYQKAAVQGDAAAQFDVGFCYDKGYGIEENNKEAIKWYKKSAEQGNAKAEYKIGEAYLSGSDVVAKSQMEAVKWFSKAAVQNLPEAQLALGYCYNLGHGVIMDKEKAVEFFSKAAIQGDADAQYALGYSYHYGDGVAKDKEKAVNWYTKAVEQGSADAQYELGRCYKTGYGVIEDKEVAVKLFKLAAAKCQSDAQYELGVAYQNGEGVPKDIDEAIFWYRKAAEQGNADAQYMLGNFYNKGVGVIANEAEAFKYYQMAAEQGIVGAQHNLANAYFYGKGTAQDYVKSFEWYTQAAEQGLSVAQYNLGNAFLFGNGVETNFVKAKEWYAKAAEQGLAAGQYSLGMCYEKGIGVEPNKEAAKKWLKKAAEQGNETAKNQLILLEQTINKQTNIIVNQAEEGDADAQYKLGNDYYYGRGTKRNYYESMKWLQMAANQGHRDAQYLLGVCYKDGKAVKENISEALKLFKLAAAQGQSDAQFMLGELYYNGIGIKKDIKMGTEFYRLAANQGHQRAKEKLIEMT